MKKFNLGQLAEHNRDKTINEIIRESVEEHLNSKSYTNIDKLLDAIKSRGFKINNEIIELLSDISSLMKRRNNKYL